MYSRSAAQRYDVIPLPFVPFSNIGGEALNNSGVVAGGIAHSDGSVSLAQWSNGVLTDCGVPLGLPGPEFNRPRVFGMNSSGAIAGTIHTAAGDLPSRWFIYDQGRFTVLPLANATDQGGAAVGVNIQGQVVGYDRTASNHLVGWLWSNGSYSRLPVSGANITALGINASGAIIGNRGLSLASRLLSGQLRYTERGYVLSHGTIQYLPGLAYAINDAGEVVGASTLKGRAMATVFRNGIATVILSLPSSAVGINSFGDVTGSYQPTGDDRRHLFLWSATSGAFDLTPDSFHGAEAAAINDRGEILGFGEIASGRSQYVLLRPNPDGALTPKAVVTEPLASAR